MSKYIIKIESKDNDTEFKEAFGKGMECDGFCIIAKQEDGHNVAIHGMSVDMIADSIAASDSLLSAAILGKAKREIKTINKPRAEDALRKLLNGLV